MPKPGPILFDRGICPALLVKAPNDAYSRRGLQDLYLGKKVSPLLGLEPPRKAGSANDAKLEQLGRLSLSGMQEKYALLQDGRTLRLTEARERGTHILKPIVQNERLNRPEAMPANEHLSMQVARQVFNIQTAACGLVWLKQGGLAYVTRRFDYRDAGQKLQIEDFAGLAGYSPQTHGEDYKYLGNYSDLFALLKQYVPAYRLVAERLLTLMLYNYLISNADAHLKNFSLIETPLGDYRLAPAYDLLNTEMHIESDPFALNQGLLPTGERGGKVHEQFMRLAELADLPVMIVERFIGSLREREADVEHLVQASYLPESSQRQWLQLYQTRRAKLERGR